MQQNQSSQPISASRYRKKPRTTKNARDRVRLRWVCLSVQVGFELLSERKLLEIFPQINSCLSLIRPHPHKKNHKHPFTLEKCRTQTKALKISEHGMFEHSGYFSRPSLKCNKFFFWSGHRYIKV